MFGHDALPSRVWKFGARVPKREEEKVFAQLRKAHRLRCRYVEIERERRKKVSELLGEINPKLLKAREDVEEAEEVLKGFEKGTPEFKEAKRALKKLRDKEKEVGKPIYATPEFKAANKAIEDEVKMRCKKAYEQAGREGLSWATRNIVKGYGSQDRKGHPPKFRKFRGGNLTIQLQRQKGDGRWRKPEHLFEEGSRISKRCQIFPDVSGTEERCGKHKRLVRFDIGTEGRGKYTHADIYVRFHRDLLDVPSDTEVAWLSLNCRRVGVEWKWSFQVTLVRTQAGFWARGDRATSHSVGVDLGWRMLKNGDVRVAEWVGDDGGYGSVTIPAAKISHWLHERELQSIRDRNFNAILKELCTWRDANKKILPEWWAERAKDLGKWESQARLAGLVLFWRQNRFPGDEAIFSRLDGGKDGHRGDAPAWRNKDRHLLTWQAHQRDGYQKWRLNLFRECARYLARRYRYCYYEDVDWSKLARRPDSWEDISKIDHETLQRYRRAAAVSYFRNALTDAFSGAGQKVVARHTTTDCYACGHRCKWDHRELWHTCENCGTAWDQDHNAGVNILSKGLDIRKKGEALEKKA